MRTLGLSKKLQPVVLGLVVGVVLYLLGEQTTGLAVLLTCVSALGLGAAAPADHVIKTIGTGSDSRLSSAAKVKIGVSDPSRKAGPVD